MFDLAGGGLIPNPALEDYHRRSSLAPKFLLSDSRSRAIVRDAIVEVCQFRRWHLHALPARCSGGACGSEAGGDRVESVFNPRTAGCRIEQMRFHHLDAGRKRPAY